MNAKAVPVWIKKSMAGVCFWTGHRQATYRNYPLGESALVAEFCNLLYANRGATDVTVSCEVQFSKLFNSGITETPNRRVDICIYSNPTKTLDNLKYLFEIKRYSRGISEIKQDLEKVLLVKQESPRIRAFVVVFSEGKLPKEYVTPKGLTSKKKIPLQTGGFARNIATMKAIKLLKSIEKGHFACALEVFANEG
jgi:hypothetical protein